jgi:hypothetical protein
MELEFTKDNWAKAAIALCYQFHRGWDKLMRDQILQTQFSKEIRFEEEFDLQTGLLGYRSRDRGRKENCFLKKLIKRTLNLIRRSVIAKVRSKTGWNLLFPSLLGKGWIYGRDDPTELRTLLVVKPFRNGEVDVSWTWQECGRRQAIQSWLEELQTQQDDNEDATEATYTTATTSNEEMPAMSQTVSQALIAKERENFRKMEANVKVSCDEHEQCMCM